MTNDLLSRFWWCCYEELLAFWSISCIQHSGCSQVDIDVHVSLATNQLSSARCYAPRWTNQFFFLEAKMSIPVPLVHIQPFRVLKSKQSSQQHWSIKFTIIILSNWQELSNHHKQGWATISTDNSYTVTIQHNYLSTAGLNFGVRLLKVHMRTAALHAEDSAGTSSG